jgi:mRNA-degrading endonuclease RelE of RelBE toxin-antitoxin system
MTYQLVTVPSAHKALKKLPKPIKTELVKALTPLKENPHLGKQLDSPFTKLRAVKIILKGTHYRVAYEVNQKQKEIIIHYAATRENFYKQLRRLNLKTA